ncbi:MAG: ABC transporter substrate-binding protein [Acidimicrobiaceae bacterium]|nr:ABC transporter substrate-binding protein [Acidimicrobiaceae bacterium]
MQVRLHLRPPARWLTAALAFVSVAAACGGGGDGGDGQPTPAVEAAPSSESGAPAQPAGAGEEAPAPADPEREATEEQELLVAPVDTTTTTAPPPDEGEAGAEGPAEPAEPRYGGTLRIGAFAEGDGLNPASNAFSTPVYLMAHPVFDPLAYFDTEGNWVPVLAESWTKVGDGTVWRMKLREGVRFHDGTELDADDVVATFRAQLADPVISIAFRSGFHPEEPMRKVDDYTVEFVGVRPSAHLPNAFTSQLGMILPSEWLERAAADPSLNQMPVGTGPFMVESRIQDEATVLVRNPDYWAADLIDIYLDRIEVYPIPDSAVAAQRLIAGDLDLIVVSETSAILTLREAADRGVVTFENHRSDESMLLINAQSAAFSDIRARQALTFATDQDLYVELLGEGTAEAADTMFHPDLIWRNPDIVQETNTPERAGPLVAAYCADIPENCSDGRINMRFAVPGPSVESDRTVDLMAATWGEFFTLDTRVKPLDEMIIDVALGNYDVALADAFGSVDPDNDVLFMECGSIGFISLNFTRHCDPERDALMYEQRAIDDLDRRVEIWHRIQEINRDAYTTIFLTHSNFTVGARGNVHNICGQIGPTGDELFCNNQGRIWPNQIWLS